MALSLTGKVWGVKAFKDGLSKTAVFSERTKGTGVLVTAVPPGKSDTITSPIRHTQLQTLPRIETLFQPCLDYRPVPNQFNFSALGRWLVGDDWSNGWPFAGYDSTQYNHVAPPNWAGQDCGSFSAIADRPFEHAVLSARSAHPGIVNVCFGDGHVSTATNDIDLAVWRALGTRNGSEALEQDY